MPIPIEVVGSLPRPECTPPVDRPFPFSVFVAIEPLTKQANRLNTCLDLQNAYADYDAGKIRKEDLVAAQDKAAQDSVTRLIDTGETLVNGRRTACLLLCYIPHY